MLTVDVEAQPARSATDPLERLVWGRFPQGDFGLSEMMDIAERHDARIVAFLDYAEEALYGEELLDVGREICRRGHDLQLHFHQDFLDASFFRERGISRGPDLNQAGAAEARYFVEHLVATHDKVATSRPVAFRGGGYRFSGALLAELARNGIVIDSSYNAARKTRPLDLGARKQFKWIDGPYEIPISVVDGFLRLPRLFDYNFNASAFTRCSVEDGVHRHAEFLDLFHERMGEDALAVLVLHSWSFLTLDDHGHFSEPNPDAPERFDAILRRLGRTSRFISSMEAAEVLTQGAVATDGELAFHYDPPAPGAPLPPTPHEAVRRVRSQNASSSADPVCSICGTPRSGFRDADDKGRQCACGSLERQRAFADLYREEQFDLAGKRLFVVAPSVVERRLFAEYGVGSLTIADVRPEAKPDVLADVCEMPQVPDESHDVVYVSYVLSVVYDVHKALSEFRRVLRPGGQFFACDPMEFGQPTQEYSDPSVITSWYGVEAFEKYRVGHFRRLGDEDTERLLAEYFALEVFDRLDAPTGTRVRWHLGTKPALTGASSGD
jgi:SAM-dependent methyltransferase